MFRHLFHGRVLRFVPAMRAYLTTCSCGAFRP